MNSKSSHCSRFNIQQFLQYFILFKNKSPNINLLPKEKLENASGEHAFSEKMLSSVLGFHNFCLFFFDIVQTLRSTFSYENKITYPLFVVLKYFPTGNMHVLIVQLILCTFNIYLVVLGENVMQIEEMSVNRTLNPTQKSIILCVLDDKHKLNHKLKSCTHFCLHTF